MSLDAISSAAAGFSVRTHKPLRQGSRFQSRSYARPEVNQPQR